MNPHFNCRKAQFVDITEIDRLIKLSARSLGLADYSADQIEGALTGAFGVDSSLIADQTYFVVEANSAIVACGGWSFRETKFGGDSKPGRDEKRLDPAQDSARIRAFFIHPDFARMGLRKHLLELCESEIRSAGFKSAEMVATLGGQRLYVSAGYSAGSSFEYPVPGGTSIKFVPMSKIF